MSTKGLFIPLSVIKGDTLDVAFDISLNSTLLNPTNITLEGQFVCNTDDTSPESFTFVASENDANKIHAILDSEITQSLKVGEYTYQIRFTHLTDLSDSSNTVGFSTTILYGSLSVLFSPIQ
jgi:invasion protein IalB